MQSSQWAENEKRESGEMKIASLWLCVVRNAKTESLGDNFFQFFDLASLPLRRETLLTSHSSCDNNIQIGINTSKKTNILDAI